MREILFRGKSKHGEWYFGFYTEGYYLDGTPVSWIDVVDRKKKETDSPTVIPETVGQFTGLTDKNGKKIFEGDVVKAVIARDLGYGKQNREETGIIGYDKIGMIGLITEYDGTIPVWSDFFQELTLSGCIDDFWFEIIGNIHDNPELLGGDRE